MATRIKVWNSRVWITQQYVNNKLTPKQIAEKAGCAEVTIYRKLREFGLIK